MAAEIDFQPYLHSIRTHYDHWWELYTLTDAQTQRMHKPRRSKGMSHGLGKRRLILG